MQDDDDLLAEFNELLLEQIELQTLDDYLAEALEEFDFLSWYDEFMALHGDLEDEEDDY